MRRRAPPERPPRHTGGPDEPWNLETLCESCHGRATGADGLTPIEAVRGCFKELPLLVTGFGGLRSLASGTKQAVWLLVIAIATGVWLTVATVVWTWCVAARRADRVARERRWLSYVRAPSTRVIIG